MDKWEYRVYIYNPDWTGRGSFEEQLNNWYQYWELVAVIPKENQRECIFKRKIQ